MSPNNSQTTAIETLGFLLKTLKLPHMNNHWQELERQALALGWTHAQFLLALCESEATQRDQARVQRALIDAHLPPGKAFSNFDFSHCSTLNQPTIIQLAQDRTWLNQGENLLLFGPSGVGKTHLAAAVGRSLVELGARVKFLCANTAVQLLQAAKANLQLQSALLKLDKYCKIAQTSAGDSHLTSAGNSHPVRQVILT
jgi:DNA replication protein DnaC